MERIKCTLKTHHLSNGSLAGPILRSTVFLQLEPHLSTELILDVDRGHGSEEAILIPSDQYTHLKELLIPISLNCSSQVSILEMCLIINEQCQV